MCVQGALDKITGVAIHINNVKRVQELESHEILGWPVGATLHSNLLIFVFISNYCFYLAVRSKFVQISMANLKRFLS